MRAQTVVYRDGREIARLAPRIDNYPNGQPMSPFVGVQSMLVNAYSEQQPAAVDLVNFLAGTDSQAAYFQSDRKVPARLSAQQAESVASDPWVATWAEQARVGTVVR